MRYLAWIAAVCCVSRIAIAADPASPLHVAKIGPQAVGAAIGKVARYVRGQDCVFRRDYADCSVRDPRSGVEYIVFGKNVTMAIAENRQAPSVALPYSIHFGESMTAVLEKLPMGDAEYWTSGNDFITSTHQYVGENDVLFDVELHFEEGALVKVVYRSDTI